METKAPTFFIGICLGLLLSSAAQASPANGAIDRDMAHWQKEHALYLHDLRLSALEQEAGNSLAPGFMVVRHLIDAALDVAYAEADRLALKEAGWARNHMNRALHKLDAAYALAPVNEQEKIVGLEKRLITTRDAHCACYGQDSQTERKSYENLRKDISRLSVDMRESSFYSSLIERSKACHAACG